MLEKLIAKYYIIICDKDTTVCNRKDFCIFFGIYFGILCVLVFMASIFKLFEVPDIFHIVLFVIFLMVHILLILVSIKRLHDLNLNGFFIFIPFIVFALLFSPSFKKNNRYIKKEISKEDKKEDEEIVKFIEKLEEQKINKEL